MYYWDKALDANAVFCVLLRTAITNQLYEIVTFNRFFFKRSFGWKTCKRTKKYPSCNKPLNTRSKICQQKTTNFWYESGKWPHIQLESKIWWLEEIKTQNMFKFDLIHGYYHKQISTSDFRGKLKKLDILFLQLLDLIKSRFCLERLFIL